MFSVREGDHTCFPQPSISLLLFLPHLYQGYESFFFPFSPFSIEVTRVLNITPTQLFPNSWGFIRAFEMARDDLEVTPIAWVFFSFYTITHVKCSWLSLGGLPENSLFTSHSNEKKIGRTSSLVWGSEGILLECLGMKAPLLSPYPRRMILSWSRDITRSTLTLRRLGLFASWGSSKLWKQVS